MFNWYKDLIEKIVGSIFEKSGEAASILDYLSVVGLSLLFMLLIALVIVLVCGAFAGPFFTHRKVFSGLKKDMRNFDETASLEVFNALKRKLWTRRILFWFILVFVYLPIIIPTILYVFSLVASLFS